MLHDLDTSSINEKVPQQDVFLARKGILSVVHLQIIYELLQHVFLPKLAQLYLSTKGHPFVLIIISTVI